MSASQPRKDDNDSDSDEEVSYSVRTSMAEKLSGPAPPPPAPKVNKLSASRDKPSAEPESKQAVVLSMITGEPLKKRPTLVQLSSKPVAAPSAPDSDFDDDEDLVPGKKRKALPKAVPTTKTSTPASQKATPRIQACGEKQLDRCVMAARDNGDKVHVTVVSLSMRLSADAGADEVWRAYARDGTGYDLCPPHERDQNELGEAEFLGLFFGNVCDPGVGDRIADMILQNRHAHVVVVDPSNKGDNFARLAACVGALKVKHRDATLGGLLYKQVLKPKDPVWKRVLAAATKCRSDVQLRGKMREFYHDHL